MFVQTSQRLFEFISHFYELFLEIDSINRLYRHIFFRLILDLCFKTILSKEKGYKKEFSFCVVWEISAIILFFPKNDFFHSLIFLCIFIYINKCCNFHPIEKPKNLTRVERCRFTRGERT